MLALVAVLFGLMMLPFGVPALIAMNYARHHPPPPDPPPRAIYVAPNPGRDAGWDWVERQDDPENADCTNQSRSFEEGCLAAVEAFRNEP